MSLDAERCRRLFFAGLGIVFATAFVSLGVQIVGLVGERGILPACELLADVRRYAEGSGQAGRVFLELPTLGWISAGDASLRVQWIAGLLLSLALFVGVAPALVLPLLWALYLSLTVLGQEFLSFQWDVLLLEVAFFAVWFAPWGFLPWGPPRWLLLRRRSPRDPTPPPPTLVATWALRLLLFRFMFASGYVKLSFGDPSWRELTALTYHYWTQPLPNPVAWFVHQSPLGFQKFSCGATLAIELAAPWLLFAGRRARNLFGLATIALMVAIAATGNYGFFEPLTIVLAFVLLDRPAGPSIAGRASEAPLTTGRALTGLVAGAAALLALVRFGEQLVQPRLRLEEPGRLAKAVDVALDGVQALATTRSGDGDRAPRFAATLERIAPFRTLNTYGLFRVMTKHRDEIVIEGSDDGVSWRPYEFRFKPGDPARAPPWCAPHMPRLDWQMWFAALGSPPRWFRRFLQRIVEGEPSVLALLEYAPFGDRPPRHLRSVLYAYRFTTPAERAQSGDWWSRTERSLYTPPLSSR